MKIIRKIKIDGKNWGELFDLPCVESINKEDVIQEDDKVKERPYVALHLDAYNGPYSLGIGYVGDIICELDNHKWFIESEGLQSDGVVFGNPVKIKLAHGGILPEKESVQAAGYDLFCPMDYTIKQGRQIIPLKFSMEMQEDMKADIRPRSGHSAKGFKVKCISSNDPIPHEVRIDADVKLGTIDADYRDDVGVILVCHDPRVNDKRYKFWIPNGWSIAQMVFSKVPPIDLQVVDELDKTVERGGGFGHSDDNLKSGKVKTGL